MQDVQATQEHRLFRELVSAGHLEVPPRELASSPAADRYIRSFWRYACRRKLVAKYTQQPSSSRIMEAVRWILNVFNPEVCVTRLLP